MIEGENGFLRKIIIKKDKRIAIDRKWTVFSEDFGRRGIESSKRNGTSGSFRGQVRRCKRFPRSQARSALHPIVSPRRFIVW